MAVHLLTVLSDSCVQIHLYTDYFFYMMLLYSIYGINVYTYLVQREWMYMDSKVLSHAVNACVPPTPWF